MSYHFWKKEKTYRDLKSIDEASKNRLESPLLTSEHDAGTEQDTA